MVLIIVVIVGIKIIHWFFAHETIFSVSSRRKTELKNNGAVHYTTIEKARKIISEQMLIGMPDQKSSFPSHRKDKVIWIFSNNDSLIEKLLRWCVLKRHSPKLHSGKNHSIKYETKLLICNISDEQISKMKINIETGIGCYLEKMDNVAISYAPIDCIDSKLGIRGK